MRIILNADDFGMSSDTVRGTIECFERGGLTSATIMPKMPATSEAIAFAKQHPQFSFGAHLTFVTDTVESPVANRRELPGLVTADGHFPASNTMRWRALFHRVPVAQLEKEIAAQIGLLRDHGVAISHVDSHGHLHKFAPFRAALQKVLPQFGITRVRNAQDIYLKRPLKSPTYWFGPLWRRKLMKHFRTTDHFYMPTSSFEQTWQKALLSRFGKSDNASLEVGAHPGYEEDWRVAERTGIQSFAQQAREAGHQIITWNDI